MDDLHEEMESRVNSSHLSEQWEGCFHLTNAGAGVEQGACAGARGLASDSSAHVLSDKLLGALQMDGLHKKMKLPVISSLFSEQYEGDFHFINAGARVKQETCTGVRGSALGLAAHVLSSKFPGALQMDDEMKLLTISSCLSDQSEGGRFHL
nr:PREDICTED: uncharacterized protein LOC107781127 [Nicotiana tabacum]